MKPRRKDGLLVGALGAIGKAMAWLVPNKVFHAIMVLGLVVVLGWLGSREISHWLSRQRVYCFDASRLIVRELPDWCTPDLRRAILSKPLAVGMCRITDPNLTQKLAASCKANPWIRGVNAVRRAYPDALMVDLEIRQPMCRVQHGGRPYVVDKDAVVLPVSSRSSPADPMRVTDLGDFCTNLPTVKGVRSNPPKEGEPWDDAALKGAIDTLLAIESAPRVASAVRITEIDVANYGGRVDARASEIVLRTQNEQEILWGRAPARSGYAELSVAEKLQGLQRLLVNYDCPRGAVLNIRFPGGGVLRGNSNL